MTIFNTIFSKTTKLVVALALVTTTFAHLGAMNLGQKTNTNGTTSPKKRTGQIQNLDKNSIRKKKRLNNTEDLDNNEIIVIEQKNIAESKNAEEVFNTLATTQTVYRKQDLRSMKNILDNKQYKQMLKTAKNEHNQVLDPYETFLKNVDPMEIIELLEGNIKQFIAYLYENNFANAKIKSLDSKAINKDEISSVINRYNTFIRLFFLSNLDVDTDEYMFTVANKFYEYCFAQKTYPAFKKLLDNQDYFPILRLIYSVINEYFSAKGWNDWSWRCLEQLKQEADSDKRIYYIAGGLDIFRLIDEGIYNITIIDPILPSQEKFYAPDWEWFVKNSNDQNGIGDTIIFQDQGVILKRSSYEEYGTFEAKLSTGKTQNVPKSLTVWEVLDMDHDNKCLGTVEIERRFCNEQDFVSNRERALLVSFNELFYITTADKDDCWGLNLSKFDLNLKLFVKQLHKPITKQVVLNMNNADSEDHKFQFCKLGSDPT